MFEMVTSGPVVAAKGSFESVWIELRAITDHRIRQTEILGARILFQKLTAADVLFAINDLAYSF